MLLFLPIMLCCSAHKFHLGQANLITCFSSPPAWVSIPLPQLSLSQFLPIFTILTILMSFFNILNKLLYNE